MHAEPPFFRDPQCVRFNQALQGDTWQDVVVATDNYHQRRRFVLSEAVATDLWCLLVEATNGDPSATVYELRAYASAQLKMG